MLDSYLPILIHVIIAIGFATVALLVNLLIGKVGTRSEIKDTAYECGMLPIGGSPRFSVKFYLVAMLFILFDIEVVFMYPWAIVFQQFIAESGLIIFWSMLSFVVILLVGYVYALKKGAFNWTN